MNKKENTLQMLIIGRNALITAIMALQNDYNVYELEDLRDEVNRTINVFKNDQIDEKMNDIDEMLF